VSAVTSMTPGRKPIGVLALQGGYEAHERMLVGLGHTTRRVRTPADLDGLGGLVLPGGESSTMLKLLGFAGLTGPLDEVVRAGLPVLATCAGLILSATRVTGPEQPSFGWLDVDVARNAWGRQVHSFEAKADLDAGSPDGVPFSLVFIRAPRMLRVGSGVEVIARVDGEPIAVRQGAVTGASFHPELTDDDRLHALIFGAPART
jgi:5'-phosphate synthase pdxT subunit